MVSNETGAHTTIASTLTSKSHGSLARHDMHMALKKIPLYASRKENSGYEQFAANRTGAQAFTAKHPDCQIAWQPNPPRKASGMSFSLGRKANSRHGSTAAEGKEAQLPQQAYCLPKILEAHHRMYLAYPSVRAEKGTVGMAVLPLWVQGQQGVQQTGGGLQGLGPQALQPLALPLAMLLSAHFWDQPLPVTASTAHMSFIMRHVMWVMILCSEPSSSPASGSATSHCTVGTFL